MTVGDAVSVPRETNGYLHRSSRFHEVPIDSDNPLALESLQRFRKDEITCALAFFETDDSELGASFAFLDRHHAIIFDVRLQMSISGWFLPQSIDFGLACFFHYLGKAHRFHLEKFHRGIDRDASPSRPRRAQRSRPTVKRGPPENYGKEDQTTVAAFLPWRGSSVLNP